MDRLNISGNNFDLARAGFAKPAAAAAKDSEESGAKVSAKTTDESAVAVESSISSANAASAESSIKDSSEAKGMVEQSVGSIIEKAETAFLAQANQSPKDVMGLLQSA